MKEAHKREVFYFVDRQGEAPFRNWLLTLKDPLTRRRILSRIQRLKNGNLGDCKSVGQNLNELRLFFGPGYRVYFGQDKDVLIVLLCGGDKKSQQKDIAMATLYWQEYLWQQKQQE